MKRGFMESQKERGEAAESKSPIEKRSLHSRLTWWPLPSRSQNISDKAGQDSTGTEKAK